MTAAGAVGIAAGAAVPRTAPPGQAQASLARFEEAVQRVGRLPVFDAQATQWSATLERDDSAIADVLPLLDSDPDLAAQIIAMARARLEAAGTGPATAIRTAVQAAMVVGVDVIAQLSATVRLGRSLERAAQQCDPARVIVARTRFAHAVAARLLHTVTDERGGPALAANRQFALAAERERQQRRQQARAAGAAEAADAADVAATGDAGAGAPRERAAAGDGDDAAAVPDIGADAGDAVPAPDATADLSAQLQTIVDVSVLGQLLCAYYLPQDWFEIQRLSVRERLDLPSAFERHLGLGDAELALHAAKRWHLPSTLLAMVAVTAWAADPDGAATPPAAPDSSRALHERMQGRLGVLARCAQDMAELAARGATADEIARACARHEDRLGVPAMELGRTMRDVQNDALLARQIDRLLGPELAGFGRSVKPADAALRLERGIDAEAGLPDGMADVNALLSRHVDLVQRCFGARHAILFVRQLSVEYYRARWFAGHFEDDLRFATFGAPAPPEIVEEALRERRPVFLPDTRQAAQRQRMSLFMVRHFGEVGACGAVPVCVGRRVPMLLYLDWDRPTRVSPDEIRVLGHFASTIAMVLQAARHA